MSTIGSQITSLVIVYSIVYSDADKKKHQSSASLAFVRGIHRWPVNSPHKWPVTRKMFPFDDVIMPLVFSHVSGIHGTSKWHVYHPPPGQFKRYGNVLVWWYEINHLLISNVKSMLQMEILFQMKQNSFLLMVQNRYGLLHKWPFRNNSDNNESMYCRKSCVSIFCKYVWYFMAST